MGSKKFRFIMFGVGFLNNYQDNCHQALRGGCVSLVACLPNHVRGFAPLESGNAYKKGDADDFKTNIVNSKWHHCKSVPGTCLYQKVSKRNHHHSSFPPRHAPCPHPQAQLPLLPPQIPSFPQPR